MFYALETLLQLCHQRIVWVDELLAEVEKVVDQVKNESLILPAKITMSLGNGEGLLEFYVWDQISWVSAHCDKYTPENLSFAKKVNKPISLDRVFLQLIGSAPEHYWFLKLVELGAIYKKQKPLVEKFYKENNLPKVFNHHLISRTSRHLSNILPRAWDRADGTPDDSKVIFSPEYFFVLAHIGYLALLCISLTGMQMSDLRQVTLGYPGTQIVPIKKFDDASGDLITKGKIVTWNVFTKNGGDERKPYYLQESITQTLKRYLEIYQKFHQGDLPGPVEFAGLYFNSGLDDHYKKNEKYRFLFQWEGNHLFSESIKVCIYFLILDHRILDKDGKPLRISPKLIHDGLTLYLAKRGVPFTKINTLFHQLNNGLSKNFEQDITPESMDMILPILLQLGGYLHRDITSIRSLDDIQELKEEALKLFGFLRDTPGGVCGTFCTCERYFKCAEIGCGDFVPDPRRRHEMEAVIRVLTKSIELNEQNGQYVSADKARKTIRNCNTILLEMDKMEKDFKISSMSETEFYNLLDGREIPPNTLLSEFDQTE